MKKSLIPILILALLLLASSAFAEISITPEAGNATVSRNDSIGLRFKIKNLDEERCIDLDTEHDESYIETNLITDRVCLNENESVNVTLTIRTENAPKGNYSIWLLAESGSDEAESRISLHVGEEPEIEFVGYSNDICRGKKEFINILVRNNSNEFKEVELQAENEMLLPYFERDELDLSPFEEKYVKLWLHPSPYSSIGRREISMFAITDDEIAKEILSVDIEDCEEEQTMDFRLRTAQSCLSVEKGKDEKIYFTVENRSDEETKFFFSAGGEINATLNATSAWLEGDEEREFYFKVNMNKNSDTKDYNVSLRVWNEDFGIQKSICIRPKKGHFSSVEVEENNLEIAQCKSAVFTIIVRNLGDYREDFSLELENSHNDVEAVLSSDEFELGKNESREIYVSVNLLEDMQLGTYEIDLVTETDNQEFRNEIRFKVVEEIQGNTDSLTGVSVTGYASSVSMDENSSKALLVSLKNNSDQTVSGITVRLLQLPNSLESLPARNIVLEAGEERVVELYLKAGEESSGEYNALLYTGNSSFSEEKQIKVFVEAVEAEEEDLVLSNLVGMAIAGGSALLGLFGLLIIILAFVFVTRVFRRKTMKKEIWMRG